MLASDLINGISDLLGWGQIDAITDEPTPDIRKVVRALNRTLSSMQIDRDWPELNVDARMDVVAPTDLAAISATKGSKTLTSAALFTSGMVGSHIVFDDYSGFYEIMAFTSTSQVTIDRIWPHANVVDKPVTVVKVKYSLPGDYDRILGGVVRNLTSEVEILEKIPSAFKQEMRDNGNTIKIDEAQYFTVNGLDSSGNSLMHFDRAFLVATTLEYSYQRKHPLVEVGAQASDDAILYPDRYELFIVDQTVAKLARDVENSAQQQQQASDAYKEAVRVNSNPGTGSERVVMTVDSLRHGAYRRR